METVDQARGACGGRQRQSARAPQQDEAMGPCEIQLGERERDVVGGRARERSSHSGRRGEGERERCRENQGERGEGEGGAERGRETD